MSIREALAELLAGHRSEASMNWVSCSCGVPYWERFAGYAAHLAEVIETDHLVVPHSDIVGTEYGWRYADPGREPRSYVADRETAIEAAAETRMLQRDRGLPVNAEMWERPVLRGTPIPLPEDGTE